MWCRSILKRVLLSQDETRAKQALKQALVSNVNARFGVMTPFDL